MMKMMKKLLALALSFSLVLTTFAGCGGEAADDDGSAEAATYNWKIQCGYPPGDQCWDIQMPMICDAITEATDGQITFEYFQPGAICEPSQVPISLSKGLLDAAISAPSDTVQLVPGAYAEQGVPFYWEVKHERVYVCRRSQQRVGLPLPAGRQGAGRLGAGI